MRGTRSEYMNENLPIEYMLPTIVDIGDLVDLTAQGGLNKPSVFCDGQSGTIGDFGQGNANRVCS